MVRSPKWKRDYMKKCRREQIERSKMEFWKRIIEGQNEMDELLGVMFRYMKGDNQ